MAVKDLGDFDFGFTAVDEKELRSFEQSLKNQVHERDMAVLSCDAKLKALHGMIMPLLNNLAKDSDRPYILWPDREEKIRKFINEINKLLEQ